MDGYEPAAVRAAVLPVLLPDELADAYCPYALQVLLDAHVEVLLVSLVHAVDPAAGIRGASKTENSVALRSAIDPVAFFEQVCAAFVPRPAAGAFASFEAVDMREIPAADGAVHAAGGDEELGYGVVGGHGK